MRFRSHSHTPAEGTVSITARDSGEEVQVEVSDTREGIAWQDQERLFERLYRTD